MLNEAIEINTSNEKLIIFSKLMTGCFYILCNLLINWVAIS